MMNTVRRIRSLQHILFPVASVTLLLAATSLWAQDGHSESGSPSQPAAHVEAQSNAHPVVPAEPNEPLRITITFKANEGGKTSTQRSYTIVSTSQENLPQIRDDSRVPIRQVSSLSGQYTYEDLRTDVDFRGLKKLGNSVFMAISISTDGFAQASLAPDAPNAVNPPIKHSHSYSVAPTLALGKLTTVYSATDTVNNTSVDVQVLVQLANVK